MQLGKYLSAHRNILIREHLTTSDIGPYVGFENVAQTQGEP